MTAASAAQEPSLLRLSDEAWAAMDEDDPGELVDGALVEEETPDWVHEAVVAWLVSVLGAWARARGGFIAGSEVKYILRRGRGRKPDLSIFLSASRPPPRSGPTRRPPDLVVEVLSGTPRDVRRDRIEKMAEYAEFGVPTYWIVDPGARTLEIFQLGKDGRYEVALGASAGVVDTIPGHEGLVVDLDQMWAEADRLGPPDDGGDGD